MRTTMNVLFPLRQRINYMNPETLTILRKVLYLLSSLCHCLHRIIKFTIVIGSHVTTPIMLIFRPRSIHRPIGAWPLN
jgi:hypothetical protein